MHRRRMMAVLGTGLVAGCSSGGNGQEPPTDTPRQTETPTPSPTPTPEPSPEITALAPISDRTDISSVTEYETSAFAVGTTPVFGVEVRAPVIDNEYDFELQASILDGDSTIADYTTEPFGGIEAESDYVERAEWVAVGPEDPVDAGDYTAEMVIRDRETGQVASQETAFSFVEPLAGDEVELVSVSSQDFSHGDRFEFDATFRNTSDRDSSIVSDTSIRYGMNDPIGLDNEVTHHLAAGGESTLEYRAGRLSDDLPTGSWTFTFTDIDTDFSFHLGS